MKTRLAKLNFTPQGGFVVIYVMLFIVSVMMGVLSMMSSQLATTIDDKRETDRGSARAMASSALQEATYYVEKTSPGFTGTVSEQLVMANGKLAGSYEYSVSKVGNRYTVNATGYTPAKANGDKVSFTMTKTFTYGNTISGKGLIVLGGSGTTAIFNSNAQFNSVNGNILIASNASNAVILNSNAQISANQIGIAGGYTMGSNTHISGTLEAGYSSPITDPYLSIPEPNEADYVISPDGATAYNLNSGKSGTLHPGIFKGPVNLNSNTTLTLSPGIYIFEQGFNANSNCTVIGNDVMIYNTGGGGLIMSSNSELSITAPTSGVYQGIAYFQKRSANTQVIVNSNAGTGFNGVVYAPGAQLMVNSNGTVVMKGETNVFNSVTFNSNAHVSVEPDVSTTVPLL